MHLQNNEQRQKKAGPGSPLPVPPSGYEYGPVGTAALPVKYVIVDLNKLYVGSLWHSERSRVSNYTRIARKVTDENNPKYNPVSPYAGLKAVSNGTFVFTPEFPAGHLVGFKQADQLFASKAVNYWPWNASAGWDPRKRWGFAVLNRGSDGVGPLTIKIDKGAGLVPDPLPLMYANSNDDYLEDKYMILIHGGYVLFKPGTLPENTLDLPELAPAGSRSYKEEFNSVNNDLFESRDAYNGTKGKHPMGRWAIGCISGSSKIVIFSSRNKMTTYNFAKAIRDNKFGGNDIEEAIIFDGGSAQGFQAVTDIKYNINDDNVTGQPDKVDCQHQTQSSNSHFAVFKIQNVALISIEGRKVPCNYSIDDKVIPVLVDRATNNLKFRIKVAKSEFFRKTYKVQMQLVSRDLYDNGVWMPSLQIVKTLDRSQITFGSEMDIELVNVDNHGNHVNEKHKALAISLSNNKGAVCILRAFDKNDEEISRQAVTVKFFTGIRIGLLLDKSPDTASVAVQAARNKAAMMIGCRALAKAKIPITGATTLTGFPTELCVIGFADTGNLVMDWSDSETDFETAIGNLYCGPGSDFYNGFSALRIRFNAIESTDGPHYCRGFFFAASKHQSHLHTFPEVLQQVGFFNTYIPVHCIGCVSADILGELTQIANTAGGKVYPASAVSDLVDLFIKAYTEDQEEEYIKTLKEPLVPGGVLTVTVKLKTRELATFQVYWEDTVAPNIVIKRPNGRAIAAGDEDVEVISGQGFTIYMVKNPRKDVSKRYDWKVEVTGRGKTGRGNMVYITVSAEKGETYSETQIVLQHEDVPGIVEQGVDMTVEVFANQFYMSPDRITFLIRHEDETEFTLYELTQQSEERWQTVVPGAVFRPGVFYSYFEAEAEALECRFPADTAFMTEVEGGTEGIVLETPLVSKITRQGESMPVFVGTAANSLQPEEVVLHIWYEEETGVGVYPLSFNHETGRWSGIIPGPFLNKAGTVCSYIKAWKDEWVAYAPPGAPDEVFKTKVKSIKSEFLPWVMEFVEKVYGEHYYKVKLTLRNADGTEKISAGFFTVYSQYWFGQHVGVDRSALTSDPFDDGAWIFDVKTVQPSPRNFRLIKVMPDGNYSRIISVSRQIRSIAVDPVRNRIWGISAVSPTDIIAVDLDSGQEIVFGQTGGVRCLTVDPVNGDIFGGGDHIHKMDTQGIWKPFKTEIRGCGYLTVLPGGEILAKVLLHVPDTPPHNIQPTILWLNPDGTTKYQTESTGQGYEIMVHDGSSNKVWVLEFINRPWGVVRYNSRLQREVYTGAYGELRFFDSIALNYFTEGIWVTGEDRKGHGFFGRIGKEGEFEHIEQVKAPGLVSTFREPAGVLQDGNVPEITFEGYDMPVSVGTTGGFDQPDEVVIHTRNQGAQAEQSYHLTLGDDRSWRGAVPGDDLKTGMVESYISARGNQSGGIVPRGAPEKSFRTDVQAGFPLWFCEYKGAGFNKNYLKVQLRKLKAIGAEEFSAGMFMVPADPRQYVVFAPGALTVDPSDGSAWVFDVSKQASSSYIFRLVNIKLDGSRREFDVSQHLTYSVIDPARKIIWGASHLSGSKIIAVNMDTGKETAVCDFEAWSLAVDAVTGDCLAWGWGRGLKRGIYRFNTDKTPELLLAEDSPCRNLNVLPEEKIVCMHDYYKKATRIVLLNYKGKILKYSKDQPGYHLTIMHDLLFDAARNLAWVIPGVPCGGLYRYDLSKDEFTMMPRRYSNFLNFITGIYSSFTLNPSSGGLWLTGPTGTSSLEKSVLAYLDPAGRIMSLADFGGTAIVRAAYISF